MLFDWRLGVVVASCALLALLMTQLPFSYRFSVGVPSGPARDAQFLGSFYPPGRVEDKPLPGRKDFARWSRAQSSFLELRGVGRRGVVVEFEVVSHRAQWDSTAPPTVVRLRSDDFAIAPLPLRLEGAHYRVYVPPEALADGRLLLSPDTDVWQSQGNDRDRRLGIAIARTVTVRSVSHNGLVTPDQQMLWGWTLGLVLLWLSVRIAGFGANGALGLTLPLAVALPLLLPLDPPRVALTGDWLFSAGLLGLLTAVVSIGGVPLLLRRAGALPAAGLLRWLILLMVISVALKYGGRLFPGSMTGDLQLHVNRYTGALHGQLYLEAEHRGLPFPFPPGHYLILAPIVLLGQNIRDVFQYTAGMFEAAAVLLMYLIVVIAGGSKRLGVVAAAVYALTSAGYMLIWHSFQTHIGAQWFQIALILMLVALWPRYRERGGWAIIALLTAIVFLSHIGQFLNTLLLGLLVAPVIWFRARDAQERTSATWLLIAGVIAGALAGLLYYSAFIDRIWEQTIIAATGGLNTLTGKRPIPREETLRVLWSGGLITHFGFFPVALAVPGVLLLAQWLKRRTPALSLIWLTFAVSLSQALLPLWTLSALSTRWFTFATWAIALTGAAAFLALWRRGRVARLVTLAIAAYIIWIAILVFVQAMALNIHPHRAVLNRLTSCVARGASYVLHFLVT
ncbi:MAG: hypothetical protein HC828_06075 [Blastochloris sp.]|nr:hypothetical protein [Blastochloris sp.]